MITVNHYNIKGKQCITKCREIKLLHDKNEVWTEMGYLCPIKDFMSCNVTVDILIENSPIDEWDLILQS